MSTFEQESHSWPVYRRLRPSWAPCQYYHWLEAVGRGRAVPEPVRAPARITIMAVNEMIAQLRGKDRLIAALDQSCGVDAGRSAPLRHSRQRLQRRCRGVPIN